MPPKFAKKLRDDGQRRQPKNESKPQGIPTLKHGKNTNLAIWKEAMTNECKHQFGMLGNLIEHDEYMLPEEINAEDYDLEDDPHGLNRDELLGLRRERMKRVVKLETDEPRMHAFMWKHCSRESMEAVLKHDGYDVHVNGDDPLALWLAIKATHRGGGNALDAVSQRSEARQLYKAVVQGPFESIVDYKKRFTYQKEAYDEAGNVELPDLDVAMDFFEGLDNARYSQYKAELRNDRAKGVAGPQTLNDMYQLASNYVVAVSNWKPGSGAAFVTGDGAKGSHTRPDRGKKSKSKSEAKKDEPDKKEKHAFKGNCFHCQEPGHMARDCPENTGDIKSGVGLTSVGQAFVSCQKFKWYEVLLDNQADISAVHPRLLQSVRNDISYVSGLSGTAELPYVGQLDGFFECKGSSELMANVLCQSDVEDMYRITYRQGKSYTVHMRGRNLVFRRRNKMYVADMREWATAAAGDVHVTTVTDNEQRYKKTEVLRARAARDITVNSGFSSERDTLGLVNDGNITGVPVTGQDVRRSFDIYGKTPHGARGRRTQHRVARVPVDVHLKSSMSERQTMYGDVMHVCGQKFVVCLTEPLGLMTAVHVTSLSASELGEAVQTQVSTIRSRGFEPTVMYLDPQPGFVPLVGQIPWVEVDISGAGDHMDVLDVKIKHVKEIMRSVHSGVPWRTPPSQVKALAFYGVSRMNLKSGSGSAVSPRVKFTGRKPQFKRELGLGFGDYVECYDPTANNEVAKSRTSPCIALYPTGNANGSWWFYNLSSKRNERRSNWDKMVTSELVIGAMNAMADYECACGAAGVNFEDLNQNQDNVVEEEKGDETLEENLPVAAGPQDDDDDDENAPELLSDSDSDSDDSDDEDGPTVTPFYERLVGDRYEYDAGDEVDQGQTNAGEEPVVRRSARLVAGTRRPQRYHAYHTSVKKGLKEHGVDAYDAIVAELKQLLRDKKAMTPVHRGDLSSRQLKKVIRSIMFLKTKYDGIGRFEKIKARLVANGAMQDRQLYPDTSSPTAMLQSVMMVLAVAALQRRKVGAIDIGGAYLNAERDPSGEEVIMELEPMLVSILAKVAPEIKPYTDRSGKLLVKLDKAMYGTLDAAKIWYDKLTGALRDMGFDHNDVDPCVMNKMFNGKQCTLVVYVDDLLISCEDGDVLTSVTEELKRRFGDVKFSQEEDISYLGMHIKVKDGAATVSMEAYVRGVLSEYPVTGVVTTPATADLFTQVNGDKLLDRKQSKTFHTIVAKLLYVAKRSRVI
jgi:hypothetical protein